MSVDSQLEKAEPDSQSRGSSKAPSRKATRKPTGTAASAGLVGVLALLGVLSQVETQLERILAPLKGSLWPLLALALVCVLALIFAARQFRRRELVALAEKPSSVGDVLGDVVGIAHRRISSDSVKGTPFARDDVVRVLRDTYGRSRQVDVRMVPHQESRSPDDVGWWRRRWRWAIGDLDDSIIERLADD